MLSSTANRVPYEVAPSYPTRWGEIVMGDERNKERKRQRCASNVDREIKTERRSERENIPRIDRRGEGASVGSTGGWQCSEPAVQGKSYAIEISHDS